MKNLNIFEPQIKTHYAFKKKKMHVNSDIPGFNVQSLNELKY